MGRRSAIPIRWAMWILLWGLTFAALAVRLPARPAYCIADRGLCRPNEFLGQETLLISNSNLRNRSTPLSDPPFLLLDLPTGRIRAIEFPRLSENADDPDERLQADGRRIWKSKEIRGWEVFGNSLVVRFWVADQSWVSVWNWQTGEQVWQRRGPPGGVCDTFGRWVWMQEEGRDRSEAVDLYDIATGGPTEAPLPGGVCAVRLTYDSIGSASSDGRFLVEFSGSPARLWWLDAKGSGRPPKSLELPDTVAAAFSRDSRYVATLSKWRPIAEGHRRVWRIFELPSARLLAEREQTSRAAYVTQPKLRFLDEGRQVVASDDEDSPRHSGVDSSGSDFIDCWDWPANEIHALGGAAGLRPLDGQIPLESKFVIDGEQVVNISTGQPVVRSNPARVIQALSPSSRWALVREMPADLHLWICGVVARWSKPLASFLAPSLRLRLQDLSTGRFVASLDLKHYPRFSPNSRWLVANRDETLEVWSLPVPRPWGRAALWSLGIWLIPLSVRFIPRRRTTPA